MKKASKDHSEGEAPEVGGKSGKYGAWKANEAFVLF